MTSRTVLVVDDERAVRDLVAVALKRAGFEVRTAGSAEEALALEAAEPIDLLVTDVILPLITGPELAKRIRARSPKTRVLFMSGFTGDALRPDDIQGGDGFLAKPFGSSMLIERVHQALANHKS